MKTKEEILEAIRRTSKKYGITLGLARLEAETGIKESDIDRYWARISDAHIEAGVKPNPFGTPPYDEEDIFEKFILLSRELNKIAVSGDWKVKRHKDSNFPSINSLERLSRRLGSRYKFLVALMKYAESKNYEDIIKMCKSKLEEMKATKSETDSEENICSIESAYVYLGKRGWRYKVGVTTDLPQRKIRLDILQPEEFKYIHVIKTNDPYKVETYWKNRFHPKLIKGTKEWFKLNSSDVRTFDSWIQKIF